MVKDANQLHANQTALGLIAAEAAALTPTPRN
jgi:hypothetical protein